MKQKIKRIFAGLILTASFLAGCNTNTAQTQDKKVEITIWHTFSDNHAEALQKAADEFNSMQDNSVITLQGQSLSDFSSKVMQAVRNQNGPSMIFDSASILPNYISDGLVSEVGRFINDPEIGIPNYKDTLSEPVYQEAVQFDGKQYMIPVNSTAPILFYNKTMYDELGLSVPKTWTELAENSQVIYDAKGIPGFGFDSLADGITTMIMQNGSEYVDIEKNTVSFYNENAVERLEWFSEQVKNGLFKLKPDDYFSTEFGSQAIASYIGSVAGYTHVVNAVDSKFEFGVAALPQEGPVKWAPAWNRGAIIFKSDDATEKACYEFVKFFIQPENNAKWCKQYNAVSPYFATNDQEDFISLVNENPGIGVVFDMMADTGYIPAFEGAVNVRNEIDKAAQEAATGLKTADQALKDAADACNSDMATYKK